MSSSLTAVPGVLALLVLLALLVWLAVAARGRARTLGIVGVALQLFGIVAGFLLGLVSDLFTDTLHLPVMGYVLIVNGTTTLLSLAGIAALVVALVTLSRTSSATQR